jgi:hypothetical protein
VVGAGVKDALALDAVNELVDCPIAQRVFVADRNDYCFTILSITRAFTRSDLQKRPEVSRLVQRRLTSWFDAVDVVNDQEHLVVREIRTGQGADDTALIDLANAAAKEVTSTVPRTSTSGQLLAARGAGK